MKYSRFDEDHRQEIRDYLGQLIQENQRSLLQLMADRIVPWDKADFLETCSIKESDFDEMLEQIASGTNPFEKWMLANGYSQEDINYIYQIIDDWLVKNGLRLSAPPDNPNLN